MQRPPRLGTPAILGHSMEGAGCSLETGELFHGVATGMLAMLWASQPTWTTANCSGHSTDHGKRQWALPCI